MSGWFDKLLEELQRRQAEEDARREGRPIERNVTPIDEGRRASSRRGSNGGNGHGGGPPVARPIFGSGTPWRRWVLIGGGIVAAIIVLGLLGGVVNLITDVMWYDALDRRDILQTRLWAQIALFGIGFFAMLVPVLVSVWLARRIAPQSPVRRLGGLGASGHLEARRPGLGGDRRAARARQRCRLERRLGDDPPLHQWRAHGAPPTRPSVETSASTSSTCPSGASCSAGPRRR